MRSIIRTSILIAFVLNAILSFAQTTTFDYLSSSLGSNCNIFNPAVTISGSQHQSRAGGVSFNSTNGLFLSTTPKASSPGATAFVIAYNFGPDFKYDISITAKGKSSMYLKTSVVPNLNQFNTNGTTSCTPDNNAWSYNLVGTGTLSVQTSTTNTVYSVPQFNVANGSSFSYLELISKIP